jgi:hypothetical protein
MEKIPQTRMYEYPVLRLVKEDFIELVKIFSDNNLQPRIEIDEFKLDSLSEIEKIKRRVITDFEITGYNPLIKLEAHKSCIFLFLSDVDDVLLQGIKSKIEILFERNKKILSHLDSLFSNIIFDIIICLGIGVIIGKYGTIGIPFGILVGIIWVYTYYNAKKRHILVYLNKSEADLTFWEKNGDLLIISTISALIATVAGGLFLKYL